ncbi:hypothetical protein L6452_41166 [Arctium lappa]|uniref:Uncharacterized protein n=1 Tax=Arctium lappa TaxID=4217 RepID=A0ACB8XPK8_ARCLA|nr:hypothetical protein L6452_41166 [Arctium lappa]
MSLEMLNTYSGGKKDLPIVFHQVLHKTMADVDLNMAFNLTPSLLEQLGKALIELEAHKDGAADTVSFTEISEHFRDLEARMMKKYSELEAREKAFKQEELDGHSLLAEKEAAVAAKEQDMFDRIQVLKDAAVAVIAETRANHPSPSFYTDDITDDAENKVSCSLDETNASLTGPKGESSGKTGGNNGGAGEVVTFLQELTQFCEQMDSKGLLTFVMENRKNSTVICEELSHALKSSTEPGRLILDSLEGFYPPPPDGTTTTQEGGDNKEDAAALQGLRQSSINLMEALSAMLARAGLGADHLLNPEIKQQAKAIADQWRPKLAHDASIDAANGKSLEAEAFLQLLATFRIASEFNEDELCKLAFAVCERRQAPELCRSLGLAHKMPGVIEELISTGKLISAVHFVHAFGLADRFPTVPLLKTYLKDLRRNSQGKRGQHSESAQNDGNARELAGLRNVVYCVQKYDLEADYPLEALHRRLGQLERANVDRKRFRDSPTKPSHTKKPRANGGGGGGGGGIQVYGYRSPAAAPLAVSGRQPPAPVYMDRPHYSAPPSSERYPPHAAMNDPYNYQPPPPPAQPTYSQQVYEQGAYYYQQDDRSAAAAAVAAAAAPPPAYGGYAGNSVQPSYQPYM